MSYCRFANTLQALQDCSERMQDGELSESENTARVRLIALCADIAVDFGGEIGRDLVEET